MLNSLCYPKLKSFLPRHSPAAQADSWFSQLPIQPPHPQPPAGTQQAFCKSWKGAHWALHYRSDPWDHMHRDCSDQEQQQQQQQQHHSFSHLRNTPQPSAKNLMDVHTPKTKDGAEEMALCGLVSSDALSSSSKPQAQ